MQMAKAEAVAIDGKTLKGAKQPSGHQVHLLTPLCKAKGLWSLRNKSTKKNNEITAAPSLLQDLDLERKVVSADAMHTQKKLVRFLVEEKGADYLGMVKDNQPTLTRGYRLSYWIRPSRKYCDWFFRKKRMPSTN